MIKERKPGIIGQREEERDLFEKLLGEHLVDVGRALDPTIRNLFTWWAPWRNLRQGNIGWRLDYILASPTIAAPRWQLRRSCRRRNLCSQDRFEALNTTLGSPNDSVRNILLFAIHLLTTLIKLLRPGSALPLSLTS